MHIVGNYNLKCEAPWWQFWAISLLSEKCFTKPKQPNSYFHTKYWKSITTIYFSSRKQLMWFYASLSLIEVSGSSTTMTKCLVLFRRKSNWWLKFWLILWWWSIVDHWIEIIKAWKWLKHETDVNTIIIRILSSSNHN